MLQQINFAFARTHKRRQMLIALTLLTSTPLAGIPVSSTLAQEYPGPLVVSRIVYFNDTNPARIGEGYPTIFNDPNVSGIQGNVFLDSFRIEPGSPLVGEVYLTNETRGVLTTSFSPTFSTGGVMGQKTL